MALPSFEGVEKVVLCNPPQESLISEGEHIYLLQPSTKKSNQQVIEDEKKRQENAAKEKDRPSKDLRIKDNRPQWFPTWSQNGPVSFESIVTADSRRRSSEAPLNLSWHDTGAIAKSGDISRQTSRTSVKSEV
jgi:hypothetical protein